MKTLSILIVLFSYTLLTGFTEINQNIVKGKIIMPKAKKTLGIGSNYDEAVAMNPMTNPDRHVVVSLHPLDFKAKTKPSQAYISQKGKAFAPKVLPVTVNSKVHFLNEDEFYHNVYSATPKARFNIGRRAPSVKATQIIKKVGVVKLGCNIHDHMKGAILSFDTPYFTKVDEKGTYLLENLPDGKYRIEVYHLNARKMTDEINIRGGQLLEKNFNLNRS